MTLSHKKHKRKVWGFLVSFFCYLFSETGSGLVDPAGLKLRGLPALKPHPVLFLRGSHVARAGRELNT